jgi:peptide deformylase
MSVLSILTWPDPRLSEVCAAIEGEDVHDLAHAMLETMYAAPGRGLAAPQVGVMRRLFVMDTTWKEGRPDPQVFINPEILEASETLVESEEGCLSIPGVKARVSRPDRVHMVWTALDGARVSQVFTGFAAACVQHEMDHLNGIVTLDRVSPEDRAVIEETYAV